MKDYLVMAWAAGFASVAKEMPMQEMLEIIKNNPFYEDFNQAFSYGRKAAQEWLNEYY
mgnify:CR=1 FL=1